MEQPAGRCPRRRSYRWPRNTIAEAAAILGATPTAVKLRAHRGYVKLRELLRAREGDG
jgi:hypothetical protein